MEETFGKYTLLSRLGSGGMAEVFVARAASVAGFEKLLAIKRLLPFCTEDKETVDLLADEARITVRLTHPNIVQVFAVGERDDLVYIVMAFVEGMTLGEWCREVLLERVDGRKPSVIEETLLAEVLALRTILLNLHFTVAKGEAITAEGMQAIIDRADANKVQKAIERLAAKPSS